MMNPSPRDYVFVCTGPTCGERGGRELVRAWKDLLVDAGAWNERRVAPVNCLGECGTGPNACALSTGRLVTGLDPSRAEAALAEAISCANHPDSVGHGSRGPET